jgi:hypothetical protein
MLKYYPQVTIWSYFANEGQVVRKTVEVATKNGHSPVHTPKAEASRLYFGGKVWYRVKGSIGIGTGDSRETAGHENKADSAADLTIPS